MNTQGWRIIAIVLPFVILMPFCLIEFLVKLPQAIKEQKKLEIELGLLRPPVEALMVESDASHKTSQAYAMERYYLDWTPDQVFQYYDELLAQNGWLFSKQYYITYGAIGRKYCKNNYTAAVDYFEFEYEWKYEISLSWGLTSECYLQQGPLIPSWICIAYPLSLIVSLVIALLLRRNDMHR